MTHNLVKHSWVGLELKIALFCDLCEPGEHGTSGDFVILEQEVPIVDTIVAEFSSDIANFDTGKWLVSLPISNLNDERLHTVVILERNAASKNHCIVGLKSESAWPELGSLDRG